MHGLTPPVVVGFCLARLADKPPMAAEIAETHLDRTPLPREADPTPEEIDARCQDLTPATPEDSLVDAGLPVLGRPLRLDRNGRCDNAHRRETIPPAHLANGNENQGLADCETAER